MTEKRIFGTMTPQEAGKLGAQRKAEKRAAELAAESGPVVTGADTDEIIRKLRDKAKNGDLGAARMLLEYVDIRKETEGRSQDKRLLALLCPETRKLIAVEVHLGELPEDLHELIADALEDRELLPAQWPTIRVGS